MKVKHFAFIYVCFGMDNHNGIGLELSKIWSLDTALPQHTVLNTSSIVQTQRNACRPLFSFIQP